MDADQALLAEAARVVDEAAEMESLSELVRMHVSVASLLAALEARINAVAAGEAT